MLGLYLPEQGRGSRIGQCAKADKDTCETCKRRKEQRERCTTSSDQPTRHLAAVRRTIGEGRVQPRLSVCSGTAKESPAVPKET
jgi:hypothetical protein